MNRKTLTIISAGVIPFVYFSSGFIRFAWNGIIRDGDTAFIILSCLIFSGVFVAIAFFQTKKHEEFFLLPAGLFFKSVVVFILGLTALGGSTMSGETIDKRLDERRVERENNERHKRESERRMALSPEEKQAEDDARKKKKADETAAKIEEEKARKMIEEANAKAKEDENARGAFAYQVGKNLRRALHDPESIKDVSASFHLARNDKEPFLILCLQLRGKNRLGAYVNNFGVFSFDQSNTTLISIGSEANEHNVAAWNKHCGERSDGFGENHATGNVRQGLGLSIWSK